MLDPKIIKENHKIIQNMLNARVIKFDLEGLIESDKKRREFIMKTGELRQKKNQIALEISQKKKNKEDASSNFIPGSNNLKYADIPDSS